MRHLLWSAGRAISFGPSTRWGKSMETRRQFFSVFKTFIDNVKKEAKKDSEFQSGLEVMEQQVSGIKESKVMKEIRKVTNTEAIKNADKAFRQKRGRVGEKVMDALTVDPNSVTYKTAKRVAESKVTQKIVEKAQDVLGIDGNESFGGFYNRDLRDRIKAERREKFQLQLEAKQRQEELLLKAASDAENGAAAAAGPSALVHVKTPKKWTAAMQDMWESSVVGRTLSDMSESYQTSNNVLIYYSRVLTDNLKGVFSENEEGQIQRLLLKYEPTFDEEAFVKECKDFIIPEVIEAVSSMHLPSLHHWFGEAASKLNFNCFNFIIINIFL